MGALYVPREGAPDNLRKSAPPSMLRHIFLILHVTIFIVHVFLLHAVLVILHVSIYEQPTQGVAAGPFPGRKVSMHGGSARGSRTCGSLLQWLAVCPEPLAHDYVAVRTGVRVAVVCRAGP